MGSINEGAKFARINEKRVTGPVPELAVLLVPGHEPEAHRDLRRVKELPRQRNHAVHQVSLNDVLADFSLAGGIRGHGAVGHDETGNTRGRQVMDEMLNPSVVGVVHQRYAVFQRASSRRRSPPQSLILKGGLARMKSARRSLCRSLWKLSAC